MKPWLQNKRVNNLSSQLANSPETETTIDWNCLSEPERQLLSKVDEIVKEYAPAKPPQDIIEKYAAMALKAIKSITTTELHPGIIYARRKTSIDARKNGFQQFQTNNPY